MITVEEALAAYEKHLSPLPAEEVSVEAGLWRVLAEPARTRIPLPPFRQSAMDGYALRSEDTRGASPQAPVRLRILGTIPAGRLRQIPRIEASQAYRIFTGGYVPEGADAILRQEEAEEAGDTLLVRKPVEKGRDLREAGEELPQGALLAPPGKRLTPGLVGALAAAGLPRIQVHRRPRVQALITGDEIARPGTPLAPGQVYNANRYLVGSWLQALGIEATIREVPDDEILLKETLAEALDVADLVITTGGVSVGQRDLVISAAQAVGVEPVFWKVRQQPGKPLFFGVRDGKPLLGLPGNPGAVYVGLVVHVRRVLDLLEGVSDPHPHFFQGELRGPFKAGNRDRWVRCRLEIRENGRVVLKALPHQGSHMISNLAQAEALARVTPETARQDPPYRVSWTPLLPWI